MELKPLKRLGGALIIAATALALVGCKGDTGPAGATGAQGAQGAQGSQGAQGTPGTPGTPGSTGQAGTNGGIAAVNVANLSSDQWANLALTGAVTSVDLSKGTPIVKFTVTGADGTPIAGLSKVTTTTAINASTNLVSYPLFAFSIAKLAPTLAPLTGLPDGSNTTTWVSYLIDSTPSAKTPTPIPGHPTTDNTGTLTEDGFGNYTYTFMRNIMNEAGWLQTQVNNKYFTGTAASGNFAPDLGDVSYQSGYTHRVGIRIGGAFPGTGSITPTGVASASPAVLPARTANLTYEFVPGTTGVAPNTTPITTGRQIVNVAVCNNCHTVLGGGGTSATGALAGVTGLSFHSGQMNDPNFCVFCHNEQLKYGSTDGLPASLATMTLASASTKLQGMSVGTNVQWIHKYHMGANLGYQGYVQNMNNGWYPQDIRKCTTCHQEVKDSKGTTLNPQFANWTDVPSREACGACHDTINWTSGNIAPGGTNPNNNQPYVHNGGPQGDDTTCKVCHKPADIVVAHTPMLSPAQNGSNVSTRGSQITNNWQSTDPTNMPAGAMTISYPTPTVTVNAAGNPVFTFQILVNGTAATITPFVAGTTPFTTEMIPNLAAGPTLGIQAGLPQDGITAPTDFNMNKETSWTLKQIWNGTAVVAGGTTLVASQGIQSTSTAGVYSITLDGIKMPAGTTLMGIGFGWTGFVQTNVPTPPNYWLQNLQNEGTPSFAWTAATSFTNNGTGGLLLPAVTVWADCSSKGYSPRRTIIAKNACNSCHGDLGAFTPNNASVNGYASNFHDVYMNDPQRCVFCHTTNGTTNGWSYNAKGWVHGIHSSGFRTNPYTARGASQFFKIVYPAVLNNCEACHVPGSYDFSASANANQIPGMLWDTVAAGAFPAASNVAAPTMTAQAAITGLTLPATGNYASPWVTIGATYGAAANGWTLPTTASATWTPAAPTAGRLVSSPMTASCSGCHDSQAAISHMVNTGNGVFYQAASSVPLAPLGGNSSTTPNGGSTLQTQENCMVCHGQGTAGDIHAVHMNFAGANQAN